MLSRLLVEETQDPGSSWEDPLEKEMAANSNILAWKLPWTEESGGLQSMGHKKSDTTEHAHTHGELYGSLLNEGKLTAS